MVITTVGGPGQFGYKQSFNSSHSINVIIEEVFNEEKLILQHIRLTYMAVMKDNILQ